MNTKLETLIAKYESKLARAQLNITDDGDDPINTLWQSDVDEFTAVLAALRQADQQAQPQGRELSDAEILAILDSSNFSTREGVCNVIRAVIAADRVIRPAAGVVLVPIEPTPEMCAAGFAVAESEHDPAGVYRAMIAASQKENKNG